MTSEHLLTLQQMHTRHRIYGVLAISGAVSMFVGAAAWGSTGIDLWQSLAQRKVASYLSAAGSVKLQFVINTTFWILGVLLMGAAGTGEWVPRQQKTLDKSK